MLASGVPRIAFPSKPLSFLYFLLCFVPSRTASSSSPSGRSAGTSVSDGLVSSSSLIKGLRLGFVLALVCEAFLTRAARLAPADEDSAENNELLSTVTKDLMPAVWGLVYDRDLDFGLGRGSLGRSGRSERGELRTAHDSNQDCERNEANAYQSPVLAFP